MLREHAIQVRAVNWLSTLMRKGTIPHALLFAGIEGVGKRSAAMMFAMAGNCLEDSMADPCGVCRSCRKIQSGNHPDIILIEPSGPFVRIEQIRFLCQTLSMKPYEARMRVVILADAQAMNPEAGNALLKMLEEPPDRTVLILTVTQTSDMLPTILSRCQHIRFDPIPGESLASLLMETQGIEMEDARILAALANGSYAKACEMSRKNWINRREWLFREIKGLTEGFPSHTPFPAARLLAFAEKLSKKKDVLSESLEVMKTWLRDIIVCRLVMNARGTYDPEKMINRDSEESIRHLSQKATASSLLSKIKAIQTAQKSLRANANVRLTLETLIIRLYKL